MDIYQRHWTDEGSDRFFSLSLALSSCRKETVARRDIDERMTWKNIDSQIGLIMRWRERGHLFLLLSLSTMYRSGLSSIEDNETKEEESHRVWYLSIVQSSLIQGNKRLQIAWICSYSSRITIDTKKTERRK